MGSKRNESFVLWTLTKHCKKDSPIVLKKSAHAFTEHQFHRIKRMKWVLLTLGFHSPWRNILPKEERDIRNVLMFGWSSCSMSVRPHKLSRNNSCGLNFLPMKQIIGET